MTDLNVVLIGGAFSVTLCDRRGRAAPEPQVLYRGRFWEEGKESPEVEDGMYSVRPCSYSVRSTQTTNSTGRIAGVGVGVDVWIPKLWAPDWGFWIAGRSKDGGPLNQTRWAG